AWLVLRDRGGLPESCETDPGRSAARRRSRPGCQSACSSHQHQSRFPTIPHQWKQEVDMGTRNNQTFVQLPHSWFIQMLQYKAQLVGITVVVREESYTSKASFLDLDDIPTYDPKRAGKPKFSGKREKRGLYRAKDGRRINADINASYNILRKAY